MKPKQHSIIGIISIITALWSLVGIIRSLILKADKIFGQITMGAFEWSLILQASIVVLIIVHWPFIVKLWKRITKQDKLDKLLNLIEQNKKSTELVLEYSPQSLLESEFLRVEEEIKKILYILSGLGFTTPNKEERVHHSFYPSWYSYINELETIIQDKKYKKALDLWSKFSSISQPTET